jgi:hypothetical protein
MAPNPLLYIQTSLLASPQSPETEALRARYRRAVEHSIGARYDKVKMAILQRRSDLRVINESSVLGRTNLGFSAEGKRGMLL